MIPIHDENPTHQPGYVTWSLMAICIVMFVVQISVKQHAGPNLVLSFGLIPAVLNDLAALPANIDKISAELTLVTSMFLHGGFMHLAGNMLYLYVFGNNVEDCMGKFRFIIFYLLCGVAAAYGQVFYHPQSTIPMIGASGAISGVLGAYLLVYPRAKVLVLIPLGFILQTIRLPAAVVLLLWFGIQFVSSLGAEPGTPGVAWYAHIGGFIAGCILIPFFKSKNIRLFQPSSPGDRGG